jgi:PAS domain S-box-containing protein
MATPATLLPRKLISTVGAGFALALGLIVAISWLGLQRIAANNAHLEAIVQEKNLKMRLANQMRDILRDRAISMLSIVVMGDAFEKDQEMLRFYGYGSQYQLVRLQLEPMLGLAEEKAVLARIDNLTRTNQPLMVRTVDLAMDGYTFLAFELLQNEGIPLQRALVRELDELISIQRAMTAQAVETARADYLRTRVLLLALGAVALLAAAVVAVTVIRRTARLAAASERERTKFRTLFETNTDGIVILDRDGFSDCNPATLQMFHMRDVDEFRKYRPEDLGMTSQPDGTSAYALAERNLRAAVENGHAFFEWNARRPDGSSFPAEIALHAMTLDGKPVIQAIMRDVSARKEVEATLKAARDAALAATEMKSRFVANVSHEIRTPMNGILGMTGLLLGTQLTPRQREYAEAINRSAEALLRVINDLLDFSKMEAGRLSLEVVEFDLQSLIQDVLTLYVPRVDAKGLKLRLERHDSLPVWVRGDPLRLRQILLNLLDNAVKFTHRGEILLRVQPSARESELEFTVRDSGIGMTPAQLAQVFQAFAQADGSVSRRYGGTGLGLTICRQLAELMGGSLDVDSVEGAGSTFTLRLPLPATAAPRAHAYASTPAIAFARARVLVAEDNPVNQKLIGYMLGNLGIECVVVSDGKTAFERLAAESYDLVLMDCQMPEWDGLTATRAIRAREASEGRGRTPIVALSANAMAGYAETCAQAGMDGYLAKPLREHELLEALARWLPAHTPGEGRRDTDPAAIDTAAPAPARVDDAQPAAPDLIDLAKLRRICRGNDAQIDEMLHLFVASSESLLAELAAAVEQRDAARTLRHAHQIKGAAAYLGIEAMAGLAAEVEEAARGGDWAACLTAQEDLEAAFIAVRLRIDTRVPTAKSDAQPVVSS